MLYYLAVEGALVSRDALRNLLWSEVPEAKAHRNLTRLLSYLRTSIPDDRILHVSRGGVSLDQEWVTSDSQQFDFLKNKDDIASWAAAAALVRGPLLDGFSLPGSYEFDSWLAAKQHAYERDHLSILAKLAVAKLESAEYEQAIRYAHRYLEIDDLAEEIHRLLILLYANAGQRSAALQQFERCMIVLERELGVEPLPETRAAYDFARLGQSANNPPSPRPSLWHTLPSLELPFIGRDRSIEALEQSYRRLRSGGVILISGPAGVGKSRLMQDYATAQDCLVLNGSCQPASSAILYQPVIQIMRQALPLKDRLRRTPAVWLTEVSRLLPELEKQFPDLPGPVSVDEANAQARIYEGITQVFRCLALDSSLLVCIDDIHWADEATLGWLHYFSDYLANSQVCILATYRSNQRDALAGWRRTLERAGSVLEIHLGGLSAAAVENLLMHTDERIKHMRELARRIHKQTNGNAFFVLETIRELLETGLLQNPPPNLPLSPSVRAAVLRRVERLSPIAQQILEVAAVLSPILEVDVISVTAARDELETANSLQELSAHYFLAAGPDLQFQHLLARDAVYENLSEWRRRLLHRRAANTLAQLGQSARERFALIASHYETAAEFERAVEFFHKAAAAAISVFAHQEAVRYLRRAIELAKRVTIETAALAAIYEDLAFSLNVLGDFGAAEECYREALKLTPEDGTLRRAQLEYKMALTFLPQERIDEGANMIHLAVARLNDATDISEKIYKETRLNMLLGLLDAQYFQWQPARMAETAQDARRLLAQVGTAAQKANFNSRIGQIQALENRFRVPDRNLETAQEALVFAQESGDSALIARQNFHLGFHYLWHGDINEAQEILQRALAMAEEIGDRWLITQCLVYLTISYRFAGDKARVEAYLPQLITFTESIDHAMYNGARHAAIAWLHYRQNEWIQAEARAKKAVSAWKDTGYPFQWLAHWILLAAALQNGKITEGAAAAGAMLNHKQQNLPDELNEFLKAAVFAWQSGHENETSAYLEAAVHRAAQQGYL